MTMLQLRAVAWLGGALLVGGVLMAACNKPVRTVRAVYFGPAPVYQLTDSTRELVPDESATAFYQRRFNFHPLVNQPLYRLVSSPTTDKVYLGLVLPPLPATLADLVVSDSVWQLMERRTLPQGAVLAWLRRKRGHEWNVRYLGASAKTKNTHVINLLSTDSAAARRFYFAEKPFGGRLLF